MTAIGTRRKYYRENNMEHPIFLFCETNRTGNARLYTTIAQLYANKALEPCN